MGILQEMDDEVRRDVVRVHCRADSRLSHFIAGRIRRTVVARPLAFATGRDSRFGRDRRDIPTVADFALHLQGYPGDPFLVGLVWASLQICAFAWNHAYSVSFD